MAVTLSCDYYLFIYSRKKEERAGSAKNCIFACTTSLNGYIIPQYLHFYYFSDVYLGYASGYREITSRPRL